MDSRLRAASVWLVLLLAAVPVAIWLLRVREPSVTPPAQTTLLVLPLHAAGNGAPDQALQAEGLSRDLIALLAQLPSLHTIAWTSAARAQAEKLDQAQIAAQLRASHALAGSLRQADDRLLLELRLSTVPGGRMLWAQTYTRKRDDWRALEREAAAAVADALGHALPEPTDAPRAGDAQLWLEFINARHLLEARERTRCTELLRDILARAPDYAPARALLARTRAAALRSGAADADDEAAQITADARRALAADAALVDAQHALAVAACHATQWAPCLDTFRRALGADPLDTDNRVTYAYWLAALGYVDAALAEAETAWRADPLNYDTNFARARLLDTRGRHDEALHYLDAATPPSPGLVYARWHNAVWRHDLVAAREFAAAMPQGDGFRESYAGITEALAEPARWPQIQPMIGTSERANGRVNVLRILMPNPDYRVEIDGLERMLRDNWPSYYLLLWMPEYVAMRRDPAFQDFLVRTHILDYWRTAGFPPQCHVSADRAMCD